ncbi:NAD-dependent epimerase/dehydratase family protein [Methylobacterium sp. J-076]|uniref:NAD-dependent epimerase/dehydratase family protein n=1 Tax=Methylobacterium sp. J-076 TaxID=2836655 RepID=UPI001FB93229|nr:NAD-dependent epimerase/dehydratase family protein [Methylobacterium sp. J-076]MCJ2015114.1 NAD-dependent epimerase/dehydratase family protein [Methylobacterium sp. J-076]
MTPVLVLGASGFVGRRLVAALAAEPDFRPIALARRPSPGAAPGVETRQADATDPAALAQALQGVAMAVNCIAGGEDAMVGATRHLCDAAPAAGVRRLVHLSSMAVYGPATGTVDETRPMDPSLGAYARAKVEGERIVAAAAAAGTVEAVILRPGCVHGAGSPQWTERMGRLLRQHRLGDLGAAGDGTCNLTYVDDLIAAIVAGLRRERAAGEAYNVSDPEPQSWNAYLLGLGRAIGAVPVTRISPRWLKIETKLIAPAVTVAQRAASRLGPAIRLPACVPPSLARTFAQEIVLDHRRASAELGFRRTPPETALAAAAAWLRTRA